jgi:long-chain acyl-CoA synthetase
MSETAGVISYTLLRGERPLGSAGALSPDIEARIEPDGEIVVRGALVMTGYLDAEDQADGFTPDGFFRTGDLGEHRDGELRITGRKKHLFVLSTGKKLSPEPIELAIAAAPPFLGAVLLGDGKPFVSVAVFVAPDELARLRTAGDPERALLEAAHARLGAFSDYEKPKRLFAVAGAPTDEPSILTPTFKVKREAFARWRASEIAALYDER